MYKLLLILKYLRRKLAPMFAALAVTLCTAMVIIVISVMGGFLQMWRDSAKKLSGEVTVSLGLAGFGHYEEMLAALRNHERVEAATAIIYTFGIVKVDRSVLKMEVVGIHPEELDKVVAYREALHWTPERIDSDIIKNRKDVNRPETWPRRDIHGTPFQQRVYVPSHPGWREFKGQDLMAAGMTLSPPKQWETEAPGMVAGIFVQPGERDNDGEFSLYRNGFQGIMGKDISVTVVPMSASGQLILEQAVKKFTVVNEVKTGFHEFDTNRMYVPFESLQQMLQMQSFPITDENNQPTPYMSPAKTTAILVKGKPGTELARLRASVVEAIAPVFYKYQMFGPLRGGVSEYRAILSNHYVKTWEEQHATILGAVEKEKFLLVFLFAIISLVAFVMVATTFYNIVLEKTRDVGVLRALGASHLGVAGLFLGYGLAIGIVGSLAGLLLAWGIVAHLNDIQDFLEKDLGVAVYCLFYALGGALLAPPVFILLGKKVRSSIGRWRIWAALAVPAVAAVVGYIVLRASPALMASVRYQFSVKIWDAKIYFFDRIPAKLDLGEVVVILIAAVISAVLGSLIPAIVASRLDPVEAIRYE